MTLGRYRWMPQELEEAQSEQTNRSQVPVVPIWTAGQLHILQQAAALLKSSVSNLPYLLPRALSQSESDVHHGDPAALTFESSTGVGHVSAASTMPGYYAGDPSSFHNDFELEDDSSFPFGNEGLTDGKYPFSHSEPTVQSLPESNLNEALALASGSGQTAQPLETLTTASWNMKNGLDFSDFELHAGYNMGRFDLGAPFEAAPMPSLTQKGSQTSALRNVGTGLSSVMEVDGLQGLNGVNSAAGNNIDQGECSHTEPENTNNDTDSTLDPMPVVANKKPHNTPRSRHHRPALSTSVVTKNPGRRGPFRDIKEREQTGVTRRLGACVRCCMQKTRCVPDLKNPLGLCMTCQSIAETAVIRPVCVRKKVTEAKLFVKGNHPQFIWSQRWKSMEIVNITNWASPEVKTIYVTQDVANLSYPLRVRSFIPEEGDSLRRTWKTGGVQMHYQCNNYAIEDMEATGRDMISFVDSSITGFINYYIDKSDPLLYQTYLIALRYTSDANADAKERELVRATLRLWVSVRMESKSERIIGDETLGQPPQDYDPECHNFGHVLVSPVMSAQIELIATVTLLNPTKAAVLKPLRKLIEANKTRSWFTVYLCLFILLHSCALLTEFENRQAKKYEKQSRYVYEDFVKELHHGSTILLSYFHYCNKGSHPLLMDWESSPDVYLAGISTEQMQFLKESSRHIKERSAHFRHIRETGAFEDPYFFLAQLYDLNWEPVRTI